MGIPLNHPGIVQAIERGLIRRADLDPRPVADLGGHTTQTLAPSVPIDASEKEFQAAVKKLAEGAGWLFFHVFDSRRSEPGYPDCTMVRPPVLIFAELKTMKGRFSEEQRVWLDALAAVSGIRVFRWSPADWPAICDALR